MGRMADPQEANAPSVECRMIPNKRTRTFHYIYLYMSIYYIYIIFIYIISIFIYIISTLSLPKSSMAQRSSAGHSKKVTRFFFPHTTVTGPSTSVGEWMIWWMGGGRGCMYMSDVWMDEWMDDGLQSTPDHHHVNLLPHATHRRGSAPCST